MMREHMVNDCLRFAVCCASARQFASDVNAIVMPVAALRASRLLGREPNVNFSRPPLEAGAVSWRFMAAACAAHTEYPPLRYVIEADFPIGFVIDDLCEFHVGHGSRPRMKFLVLRELFNRGNDRPRQRLRLMDRLWTVKPKHSFLAGKHTGRACLLDCHADERERRSAVVYFHCRHKPISH